MGIPTKLPNREIYVISLKNIFHSISFPTPNQDVRREEKEPQTDDIKPVFPL
jgi:hypothetical protein